MKNGMMVALALAAAGMTGCGGANRALTKGQVSDVWSAASDKETIRLRGIGVPPETAKSETQRRGQARNAALVNGRYEALALLRGIKVTGGLSVAQLMEKDSHVREIANQVIAGMEEVQTEWASDGGCVVLLEIKRSKLERMLADAGVADTSVAYQAVEDRSNTKNTGSAQ